MRGPRARQQKLSPWSFNAHSGHRLRSGLAQMVFLITARGLILIGSVIPLRPRSLTKKSSALCGAPHKRCGFPGLAAKVQTALGENPLSGDVFIFRGRRGDLIKILWATDDGVWLLAKRLTNGRFIWPQADGGKIHLTSAQLSMVLEGIDWRQPRRTAALSMA